MSKKFFQIIALSAMIGSMGSTDKAVAGFSDEPKEVCIKPAVDKPNSKSNDASKCAEACGAYCGKNPPESHYKSIRCKFKKLETCGCSCDK